MVVENNRARAAQNAGYPLLQPEENLLTVHYRPAEGERVMENPPRFQWLPPQVGQHSYEIELSIVAETGEAEIEPIYHSGIHFAFFTPAEPMAPGRYIWRYRCHSEQRGVSAWSTARRFAIDENAVYAPNQFNSKRAAGPHPRLAIAPDRHKALVNELSHHPQWVDFMARSVTPWIDRDIPAEPAPYPGNVRTASLWRKSYITCQEALYAIRNLAIAGSLGRDESLKARAREWLLSLADWDTDGATSRAYNDEAAFRCAVALAWGYDWLAADLSPEEAQRVRKSVKARGQQVAAHVMNASRIDTFPYDSHAVRAVSAVLVPVGLALAGEDEEATEWLAFAANYLAGPYSAWADNEGGWAEGIHYWTTAMCYTLEAATLLRNATGLDLFQRPFFRNTGNFPLYCRPAWTRRGTFGDDSTLGDAPSPKIARNMRLLAAATGIAEYAGYADQIDDVSDSDEGAFYNYGWWDLRFDDLLREASFGAVEASSMLSEPQLKLFPGVGWAALETRMDDPADHIHCLFKSSPYGSISHSHADQNALCLSAFGEDLLVQSGYYVAHHSSMHRFWRRQTLSKNALLIDGMGQYAGDDKLLARSASGKIIGHGTEDNHLWAAGDATNAYAALNPTVLKAERHVHMMFGAAILVVDLIETSEPIALTWLGHSMAELSVGTMAATIEAGAVTAGIEVVYSLAPIAKLRVVEGFDGVAPEEIAGLPSSRRLEIHTQKAKSHVLAVAINPVKTGESTKVLCFVEDQGFGKSIYCLGPSGQSVRVRLTAVK